MHIDQAIKILSEAKASGTENVILAFWKADAFNFTESEEWANITEIIEDSMDWSYAHDLISTIIEQEKE